MCLFFALYNLMDELELTLSAVHVNHKFRPGAAEEDQEYVENLSRKLGIRQTSVVKDCNIVAKEYGITSEEAGRRVRYEAFDAEADYVLTHLGKRKDQIKIAVAHNADDQAETILFRLIRGTGTDGLSGIERKRLSEKGYTIIRPILGIKRSDIEAFCDELGLNPRIDHTNLEPIYSRNKIRLGLIPYISENFNENITEALNRLAIIAGEDKEYLWQKTEEAYAAARRTSDTEVVLSLEALKTSPKAIRHRMIMKAFSEIGLMRDIGQAHMESADALIERGVTGKTAEFPYGYSMVTRYEDVAFKAPSSEKAKVNNNDENPAHPETQDQDLIIRAISLHEWNAYNISKRNGIKNYAAFDFDIISENYAVFSAEQKPENAHNLPVAIRTRQAGDYIRLTSGTKKLQDFFVDNKVPRDQRDIIRVVAAGNEILWIPGRDSGIENAPLERGRYSSNYSVSNTTKQVLILELAQKLC
ncbi:MAG: tRNA lysidine(34) synthetase TilS [Firmicutes bacterium]|nr:tRNA lysidine(34) synthetase TilS [Bacillota bacterium]